MNVPLRDLRGPWGRLPDRGRLLLAPLGWLYGLGAALNGARQASRAQGCEKPVVSVGNLEVGGTGKTPATLALAELLLTAGRRPGIVTGLWGAAGGAAMLASHEPNFASSAPDEARLYARRLPAIPVVSADRKVDGARRLDGNPDCDIILVDDGFQHRRLERDLDLLLLSSVDVLGKHAILPAGPLREFPAALKRADRLLMEGDGPAPAGLQARTIRYRLESGPLHDVDGARVDADPGGYVLVSAIARPERFEASAAEFCGRRGVPVLERLRFRDHEEWSERIAGEVREALGRHPGGRLLTTEKDARRWAPFVGIDTVSPRYLGLKLVFESPEELLGLLGAVGS